MSLLPSISIPKILDRDWSTWGRVVIVLPGRPILWVGDVNWSGAVVICHDCAAVSFTLLEELTWSEITSMMEDSLRVVVGRSSIYGSGVRTAPDGEMDVWLPSNERWRSAANWEPRWAKAMSRFSLWFVLAGGSAALARHNFLTIPITLNAVWCLAMSHWTSSFIGPKCGLSQRPSSSTTGAWGGYCICGLGLLRSGPYRSCGSSSVLGSSRFGPSEARRSLGQPPFGFQKAIYHARHVSLEATYLLPPIAQRGWIGKDFPMEISLFWEQSHACPDATGVPFSSPLAIKSWEHGNWFYFRWTAYRTVRVHCLLPGNTGIRSTGTVCSPVAVGELGTVRYLLTTLLPR